RSSKSLAKTCKSGSHSPVALGSRIQGRLYPLSKFRGKKIGAIKRVQATQPRAKGLSRALKESLGFSCPPMVDLEYRRGRQIPVPSRQASIRFRFSQGLVPTIVGLHFLVQRDRSLVQAPDVRDQNCPW